VEALEAHNRRPIRVKLLSLDLTFLQLLFGTARWMSWVTPCRLLVGR